MIAALLGIAAIIAVGLLLTALLAGPHVVDTRKPPKGLILLLALLTATSACDLRTKSKAVKLAVSTESALATFQDSLRHVCNPDVPFPTPIRACTQSSIDLGLTTAKFREASGHLATAFDAMEQQVVPALRLWKVCPSPADECKGIKTPQAAFTAFYALVDDAVTILRTLGNNPKLKAILDGIQLVTDALGALGARVVRMEQP